MTLTASQIDFACRFFTDKLKENDDVSSADAKRFAKAMGVILQKHEPPAVCVNWSPQLYLNLAFEEAGLNPDLFPRCHVNMLFSRDGGVCIWQPGDPWRRITAAKLRRA